MNFGKGVVKLRIPILILSLILVVPSLIGMLKTRINYDMLSYLPSDMETMAGQEILKDEFGKGAFSFLIFENLPNEDVAAYKEKIEAIDHVETVLWYNSFLDLSVPTEMLPQEILDVFMKDDATMMAVFFDTGTSEDATMEAVNEIKKVTDHQCLVSGMSAMVTELRELCEKEEAIYVAIAVILALAAMFLFLDNFLIPIVFITSIGIAILYNMGTNIFFGQISFITMALAAVLQLAVTMDYSIFLWHCYSEQKQKRDNNLEAMAKAINETLVSVVGSSVTTIAGFIALCFMTYTLGRDLGLVMAKGVVVGVIGCVTILPSMILVLDKPLSRCSHKALIPNTDSFAGKILKIFPVFLAIFILVGVPGYLGYSKVNSEAYYDLTQTLPEDMDVVVANTTMEEKFDSGAMHMILMDKNVDDNEKKEMLELLKQVDGINYAIGMESLIGSSIPEEFIPEKVEEIFKSGDYELFLLGSAYKTGSDEANAQVEKLAPIVKAYDENALLIGEAPCTKDLIDTTNIDFQVVNAVSIILIFLIILLVEKSITLPFLLVAVIEVCIFINLGISHYMGTSLPFIAPICISTIQLGATVDYAILMTTRYKKERMNGKTKKEATQIALSTSIPSVIVSAMGLFAATFGVAIYSDIEMISSICILLARGALISMVAVIFVLPSMFMLFDKLICKTTIGMKKAV